MVAIDTDLDILLQPTYQITQLAVNFGTRSRGGSTIEIGYHSTCLPLMSCDFIYPTVLECVWQLGILMENYGRLLKVGSSIPLGLWERVILSLKIILI